MALSPWHVASRFSLEEVAALLTGFDISLAKTGNVPDHEIKEYEEWCRIITVAAKEGDLEPDSVDVLVEDSQVDPNPDIDPLTGAERCVYVITGTHWRHCDVGNPSWREPHKKLRLILGRQEVYRWLKASGALDADIPGALRVLPVEQSKDNNDEKIHPKQEATYHKVIAALLAIEYGEVEIKLPYPLADEVLKDCQTMGIEAPACRNTLSKIFGQLATVQKVSPD